MRPSFVTQPNMYARGILFGKMKYELGDHSFVRCPENHLVADVEFKTKGYFGGTYNAIGGVIKNDKTGEVLYELSGMWSGEMVAKNVAVGTFTRLFMASRADFNHRLARKKSFSMPRTQSILHQSFGQSKNKKSANHSDSGSLQSLRSRNPTTQPPPTRSQRLKTVNGTRLPRGRNRASSGSQGISGKYGVALVDQKRVKKLLTGY